MANMSLKKNPMPSQDPNVRNKNFDEVALGYTEEQALDEATRCLNCKNKPCMQGCPVMVHIPDFIAEVAKGDFEAAYQIIAATSALPAVCGRVCPQESQCEKHCVRGIKGEPVGIGVAVVGSGPSGLTCAGDLARKGYDVTVFEALHLAGGVLVYGIPEFRLPKAIVQKEVDGLKALGVTIATDTVVGRTITVDELMEEQGFDPRRQLQGRSVRQRVPDPHQSDEGLQARLRHPAGTPQEGGRGGRRQRGYGRRPLRQASGR